MTPEDITPDDATSDDTSKNGTASGKAAPESDEPAPMVKRSWRPATTAAARSPSLPPDSADSASGEPASGEPSADGGQEGEEPARTEPTTDALASDADDAAPHPSAQEPRPPDGPARETQSATGVGTPGGDTTAKGNGREGGTSHESTDVDFSLAGAAAEDPPVPRNANAVPGDTATGDDAASDDASDSTSDDPPREAPNAPAPGDLEQTQKAGKQVNEETFADAAGGSGGGDSGTERSWADAIQDHSDSPPSRGAPDEEFFTDQRRHAPGAERVEETLQDFAHKINEGAAQTDWTPSERKDRRIASMFARLASKVAEDMSYERAPGDAFWDPRKIMRRQIDRRPLRHCKMDYTKRRLALLVDTSPSCRDEAVFYSKIATGALLRDDIDIFLCPNGRIDARFDPEACRFVVDDRGGEWDLSGRVVLYFTDWDGADEIVKHSRDCTLYWFDNRPPQDYWESTMERRQRVRLQYRGRHFHCPDPDAFRRLARKIRP